jgi:hypothetical protein
VKLDVSENAAERVFFSGEYAIVLERDNIKKNNIL